MVFQDKTIAFIGSGAMGSTMIRGLLNNDLVSPWQIVVSDPDETRGNALKDELGINYVTDNVIAVDGADMVVLAVKPQVIDKVLNVLRGHVDFVPLILSIAAGVKIRWIAEDLHNTRIVRAMPNTPAQIGQGISVWTATYEVMDEQRRQARALLEALGEEMYVDDESYLDMATALSGSGPAYVFLFIEAMIDAGVRMGFPRAQAEKLAVQTVLGSAQYLKTSGQHPTLLRNQVTSPGGTTAAGLFELEKHGLRTAIAEGIWAAYQRSIELGEDED
jgi:pyrroline-5-carboxylate reductase